ncbi:unnamed protein product [Lampetra planeri]
MNAKPHHVQIVLPTVSKYFHFWELRNGQEVYRLDGTTVTPLPNGTAVRFTTPPYVFSGMDESAAMMVVNGCRHNEQCMRPQRLGLHAAQGLQWASLYDCIPVGSYGALVGPSFLHTSTRCMDVQVAELESRPSRWLT